MSRSDVQRMTRPDSIRVCLRFACFDRNCSTRKRLLLLLSHRQATDAACCNCLLQIIDPQQPARQCSPCKLWTCHYSNAICVPMMSDLFTCCNIASGDPGPGPRCPDWHIQTQFVILLRRLSYECHLPFAKIGIILMKTSRHTQISRVGTDTVPA